MPDGSMAVLFGRYLQFFVCFEYQMLCYIILLKSTMHKAEQPLSTLNEKSTALANSVDELFDVFICWRPFIKRRHVLASDLLDYCLGKQQITTMHLICQTTQHLLCQRNLVGRKGPPSRLLVPIIEQRACHNLIQFNSSMRECPAALL